MTTLSPPGTPTGPTSGTFCGHCGKPDDGGLPALEKHQRCIELLTLEPPRYCVHCQRRMKVQVTPTGWNAECSRHGVLIR